MKRIWMAVSAMIFSGAAAGALAQDGQFFVNGNIGQSNFGFDDIGSAHRDNTDTQGALRFGYAWQGKLDYGVEVGYADLGQAAFKGDYSLINAGGSVTHGTYRETISAKGWLAGGNLKYHFDSPWYLSARGGWFQAQTTTRFQPDDFGRFSQSQTRGYIGFGVGYDLSKSFSVGLGYDYYDLGGRYSNGRVNAYSASAEVRF